jgi:hypothetical protein
MPGEWWFDSAASILYIYPATPVTGGNDEAARARDLSQVKLGYWHGPGLVALTKSSFVTVRDLTVSGCAKDTAISISGTPPGQSN